MQRFAYRLFYDDIEDLREIVRQLRHKGIMASALIPPPMQRDKSLHTKRTSFALDGI